MSKLRSFRQEAETLTNAICAKEQDLGQRVLVNQNVRCDVHMWLKTNLKEN